jgi:hypothetical protein
MSQAELAEEMAKLGTGWKRTTVVNLEKRGTSSRARSAGPGRDVVTAQELLTLARVFDVPPVWLLIDPQDGRDTPVTNEDSRDPWTALLWLAGKRPLDEEPGSWWHRTSQPLARVYEVAARIELIQRAAAGREAQSVVLGVDDPEQERLAAEQDRSTLRGMARLLRELAESGMVLPPIPPDVAKRAADLGIDLPGGED